jgi:hypothetical protein
MLHKQRRPGSKYDSFVRYDYRRRHPFPCHFMLFPEGCLSVDVHPVAYSISSCEGICATPGQHNRFVALLITPTNLK